MGDGRKRGAFEGSFHNSPRSRPTFLTAMIDGIDPDGRTCSVSYLGQESGPPQATIWGAFGENTLPVPNTMTMIVIDDAGRAHAIGFREIGWPNRQDTGQVPPVLHGEMAWRSKEFGQRVFFRRDGVLELMVGSEEGIEIQPTRRIRAKHNSLFEVFANAVRISAGVVRRSTGLAPTLDEDVVIPTIPGGPPHREFFVDVGYVPQPPPASPLQRAFRLIGGTGVIGDRGEPELGSFAKLPLRFVLEVLSPGVSSVLPLSVMQVDMAGNFSLASKAVMQLESALMTRILAPIVQIEANGIILGSFPTDVALLAYRFLLFFAQHFHIAPQLPAGSLPTTPPVTPIPLAFVTSQTVALQ